ncbi:MAG: hypothetical protein ABIO67_07510 [Mycobacteriales bacterium]
MTDHSPQPTVTPLIVVSSLLCIMISLMVTMKGGAAENAMTALVVAMSLVLAVLIARTARQRRSPVVASTGEPRG